jgi:PIN domain nuclease of toxin-antitoxin system
MLNLDTHILLFALNGELKARERKLLENHEWSISAIVLWEILKLFQLGRVNMNPAEQPLRSILSRLKTWPIQLTTVLQIQELDIRSDPADEIIAATSLEYNIPLLTRDLKLKKSKRIPLA